LILAKATRGDNDQKCEKPNMKTVHLTIQAGDTYSSKGTLTINITPREKPACLFLTVH